MQSMTPNWLHLGCPGTGPKTLLLGPIRCLRRPHLHTQLLAARVHSQARSLVQHRCGVGRQGHPLSPQGTQKLAGVQLRPWSKRTTSHDSLMQAGQMEQLLLCSVGQPNLAMRFLNISMWLRTWLFHHECVIYRRQRKIIECRLVAQLLLKLKDKQP